MCSLRCALAKLPCSGDILLCLFLIIGCVVASEIQEEHGGHFTPTWAVHIRGGRQVADAVAAEHGFINLGQIFDDHYHFHHNSVRRRSIDPSHHHHKKLASDYRVHWAKQQKLLSRKKRDFIPVSLEPVQSSSSPDPTSTGTVRNEESLPTASFAASNPDIPVPVQGFEAPNRSDRDLPLLNSRRSSKGIAGSPDDRFPLTDHRWPQMWYLNRGGGLDMNVIPAWKEGVTGKGIVVTILDDGLEKDHPDLLYNYDPHASYDVNNHDEDPMPRYDLIDSNRHGTRCAGEVAATANNSLCAVGVAFGASVGGVRMLDGDVTDAVEARSLSLNPQHIDIYSASWGPDDDGKTVDGPGELATRAFIEGVTKGRGGKGSIFIWASGNGGRDQDNCNCDGYTNSIWTLSISSATERGEVPWYSEMCSSTLATTYSSGATVEKQVVTTDLHHSCTSSHTGTSASAPLAAGICALALEANKDLTWRDMQHIVVRTAKPANLQSTGWVINGVGRNVSHSFGYGLLDATAMVRLARSWRTVPAQKRCEVSAPHADKAIPPKSQVQLQLAVNHCSGVNYLEHIQAKISLTSARRGDLQINLTSPAGTRVTLLAPRAHDTSRAGFSSWPFMSVHTWGESPYGVWLLEIHNEGRYMAGLTQWDMIFYGTQQPAQQEYDSSHDQKLTPLSDVGQDNADAGIHNSLETETNSRWRDSQRIREDGRFDQHLTSIGEEVATSACLSYSENQRCIGLCIFLLLILYKKWPFLVTDHRTTATTRRIFRKKDTAEGTQSAVSQDSEKTIAHNRDVLDVNEEVAECENKEKLITIVHKINNILSGAELNNNLINVSELTTNCSNSKPCTEPSAVRGVQLDLITSCTPRVRSLNILVNNPFITSNKHIGATCKSFALSFRVHLIHPNDATPQARMRLRRMSTHYISESSSLGHLPTTAIALYSCLNNYPLEELSPYPGQPSEPLRSSI